MELDRALEIWNLRGWAADYRIFLPQIEARIQDAHRYRAEIDTFDAYCRSRWEYGRRDVLRLISAAQVYTLLLTNCQHRPPQSEAQLRPLAGLTAEQAQLAWQTAVEKSRGGRVTARLVQSAVQAQQVSSGKPLVASQPRPSPGERLRQVQGAIGELLVLISQKASYDLEHGRNVAAEPEEVRLFRGQCLVLAP